MTLQSGFAAAAAPRLDWAMGNITEWTSLVTAECEPDADAARDLRDVRAALGGDEDAYARIVQRYQPVIYKQMWRFTRDRTQLDELVQEAFVEAYFSLKGYKAKAPFLHWLRRIATRVGYRHWKRESRQDKIRESARTVAEERPAGLHPNRPSDAGEIVHRYLEQLSPPDRLVLTLIYLEQCDTSDIAERTGWSQTLVRVRAHRARGRLRKIMEREGIEV